jgi:hypothetical protein
VNIWRRLRAPGHPDYLLRPGEFLEVVRGALRVVVNEDVIMEQPRPAVVQRIRARNESPPNQAADEMRTN